MKNVQSRKHSIDISIEDAWQLFLKQGRKCAITKDEIFFPSSGVNAVGRTASLDRIDSSKGYVLNNVQWVHQDVNLMKGQMTQKRLFELCQKVIDNCPQVR